MELLCIQTHSEGVVVAGNPYPFISDQPPCGCQNLVDVGVRSALFKHPMGHMATYPMGHPVRCAHCKNTYKNSGVWWLSKKLFVPIAGEEEMARLKEEKEVVRNIY